MRLIVALLLLALPAPAWAEWVRFTANKEQTITHYYDPTTIEKHDDKVRVWKLQDFKEPRELGALSVSLLAEYDCSNEKGHSLSSSWHSGRMATGVVLGARDTPGKWSHLPPGTVGASMLYFVCAPARAEWVKYSETAHVDAYYDPATLKKNADVRRVWLIQDLKQRNKDGVLSRRALDEYDCGQERFRNLSLTEHSEQKAGGKMRRYISAPLVWMNVTPKTLGAVTLNMVCK